MSRTLLIGVFAVCVVLGVVAQAWVAPILATFTDAGDAEGSVEATSDFGGGPIAEAGGPYSVNESKSVELDGTGSSTSQGSIDSYDFVVTSGPGTLIANDTATPTYDAPSNIGSDTTATVELTVTTTQGENDTDTATVNVTNVGGPDPPSVDDLTVTATGSGGLRVEANVSDPTTDTDTLGSVDIVVVRTKNGQTAYENRGIAVSGDDDSVSDTTGALPGNGEEYRVEVTVTDSSGDSDTASTTQRN